MQTNNVNSMSGGYGFATQLALLEVESEQAQYRADCTIRDASREAKREHNEHQIKELRDKASSLMVEAITSGALQAASGAVQFASVSSRLDAANAKLEGDQLGRCLEQTPGDSSSRADLLGRKEVLERKAIQADAVANKLCATSTVLKGSADTVKATFGAITSGQDARATAAAHSAENAQWRADDAQEAARRRQSQLDQKLGILQQAMDAEAETRRAIIRG